MSRTVTTGRTDLSVDVQVACDDPDIPDKEQICAWVAATVAASNHDSEANVEVSVRVVDADEIQTLNQLYRGQDKRTNVLSFPADAAALPAGEVTLLGDIVVCAPVVRAEALQQGKALASHWAHMLVHGTLHLLGYEHEAEAEAAVMEGLEANILAQQGIANPYASPE